MAVTLLPINQRTNFYTGGLKTAHYIFDMNIIQDRLQETEVESTIINAFGNPHFDDERVAADIQAIIEQKKQNGENWGSLNALQNALPILVKYAKEKY